MVQLKLGTELILNAGGKRHDVVGDPQGAGMELREALETLKPLN